MKAKMKDVREPKPERGAESIVDLLESLQRLLDLRICFHDRLGLARLPGRFGQHGSACCVHFKKRNQRLCTAYDSTETHEFLSKNPNGRINRCPAGFVEVAVPVSSDGVFLGVLFAGPFADAGRSGKAAQGPQPERAPSKAWLEDCREAMLCAAARIGETLRPKEWPGESDRKRRIHRFLCANFVSEVSLKALSKELHVSESRAGHIVKQLFGTPLSGLLEGLRLKNAAELLSSSDMPVSEIAFKSGFNDQNYFSRRFRKAYGKAPLGYRKANFRSP